QAPLDHLLSRITGNHAAAKNDVFARTHRSSIFRPIASAYFCNRRQIAECLLWLGRGECRNFPILISNRFLCRESALTGCHFYRQLYRRNLSPAQEKTRPPTR